MKELLLIYNPNSGSKSFKLSLDQCIEVFQGAGYICTIFRSQIYGDIDEYLSGIDKEKFDTLVISGGDGSINIVLNAMMKYNLHKPLGIIPSGTANDFASFLKIPKIPQKAAEMIVNNNIIKCDVGLVNDTYFINVFSAGLLTNISQQVDNNFKNSIGKLAYYIKGIEQIPNFVPISVRITNSIEVIEEDIYLFFILNSAGTGGFDKLSKNASITDGYFDFIAIKARPIVEIAVLFVKILSGDYFDDAGILYFTDKYIKIECLSGNPMHNETDIDGEVGPDLPAIVQNIHNAIEIFIP